jgi:hypothetical protein
MDGDNWTTVITALVTGMVTLIGVGLTQRHAATLRRLDRQEARRVEQRVALADVLVQGRQWAWVLSDLAEKATKGNFEPVGTFVSGERVTLDDLDRQLQHLRPAQEAHSRALLTARLVVRDEQVRKYLSDLSARTTKVIQLTRHLESVAEDASPGFARNLGPPLRDEARDYLRRLVGLEQLTRQRVVEDPPPNPPRRRLWPRRGIRTYDEESGLNLS